MIALLHEPVKRFWTVSRRESDEFKAGSISATGPDGDGGRGPHRQP